MVHEYGKFSKEFSEASFWLKCKKVARVAGLKVMYAALLLFYALQDPAVPKKTKGIIMGALGYFIFPLDAIADIIPVLGYADDIGVLLLALAAVAVHVSPETKQKARGKLDEWFGGEVDESQLQEIDTKIDE
ncbi:MAG: YkvA family protein [Bacillota bacterium]|nr:YkvA family protein [Bacillota bacterium]